MSYKPNYTDNELQRSLNSYLNDPTYEMTIIVSHKGAKTKTLNLNLECIESLRDMLEIIEEQLELDGDLNLE